jgi:hypothetical protein
MFKFNNERLCHPDRVVYGHAMVEADMYTRREINLKGAWRSRLKQAKTKSLMTMTLCPMGGWCSDNEEMVAFSVIMFEVEVTLLFRYAYMVLRPGRGKENP